MTYANGNVFRKSYHEWTGSETGSIYLVDESIATAWGKPAELGIDTAVGGDSMAFAGEIEIISLEQAWEGAGEHGHRIIMPFLWAYNSFGSPRQGYLYWGTSQEINTELGIAVVRTAAGTADTLQVSLPASWWTTSDNSSVLCIVRAECVSGAGYAEVTP